jgi:uncharacterized damage-inducible protein DinB
MMPPQRWFDRRFAFDLPIELFPNILERLRGTPARLEERLVPLSRAVLVRKIDGAWSIQENAGHLLDLEPLWSRRLDDLIAGREQMTAADLDNRRTHEAGHNSRALDEILAGFRQARVSFIARLERADERVLAASARHPRLGIAMRLIDSAFFVAEHDDHHLATITTLIR